MDKYIRKLYTQAGYDVVDVKLYESMNLIEVTVNTLWGLYTCIHSTINGLQCIEDPTIWSQQSIWNIENDY